MRFNGEDASALYVLRTIQEALSVALDTCSSCTSLLKQYVSPQRWQPRSILGCDTKVSSPALKSEG